MKRLRLLLFAIITLQFGSLAKAQGFNPEDYIGKDDFFKYVILSDGFHTKDKAQCKNLNSKFAIWQYADTADFDLHKVHVFTHDNKADSIRLDTVFTPADRSYIMSQFKYYCYKGQLWETCGSWRVLKLSAASKIIIPYWEFSYPLYNKDFTKCLVKMNYYKLESDYVMSTVLFVKNKRGFWKEKAVIRLNSPGGK